LCALLPGIFSTIVTNEVCAVEYLSLDIIGSSRSILFVIEGTLLGMRSERMIVPLEVMTILFAFDNECAVRMPSNGVLVGKAVAPPPIKVEILPVTPSIRRILALL
jgi:hypothetical protein